MTQRRSAPVTVDVRRWGWRHAGRRSWALRAVDLHIEPGQRVLLLGPSGSGKSTLLTALAGLSDPADAAETEGTIELDGKPVRQQRARAGLVLQDPESGLVMARAGDDVAFGLENHSVATADIWARVDGALADVGFPYGRDRPTHALSGGEQQRLAIAGILALRPGLLLLDEVTANLDPAGVRLVLDVLARTLADSGATAVIVEHRVEDVLDLVDRVVVLETGGGVIADGAPSEVFDRHGASLAAAGVWVPGHHPVVRRHARVSSQVPQIVGKGVAFRYPGAPVLALAPTDVTLRCGTTLAVTGGNGSGKSTLALLLGGLLRPTYGSVTTRAAAGAAPLWKWRADELVGLIGTVFQNPEHQFVTGSVRAELMVGCRRSDEANTRRRADQLLERLRLTQLADANPFTLSGGEKRRLSVATALVHSPAVVIADEPTFGQDSATWAELAHLFADLRNNGSAVAFATHDRTLIDAVADEELPLADAANR